MSLLSNVAKIAYCSEIPIDKVLGTYTGTFICSAPTPAQGYLVSETNFATNIPVTTFFQGIYSLDFGTTWQDFNATRPNLTTPGQPVFGIPNIYGLSQANNFKIQAVNMTDYTHNTNTTFTVMYKVALLAKPNQGAITPQPTGSNLYFDSRLNYQKIQSDTSQTFSIGSGGSQTLTFAHNLGYVPKIRSYLDSAWSFGTGIAETAMYMASDSYQGLRIDGSNVYLDFDNTNNPGAFSGTAFVRVYYDY